MKRPVSKYSEDGLYIRPGASPVGCCMGVIQGEKKQKIVPSHLIIEHKKRASLNVILKRGSTVSFIP